MTLGPQSGFPDWQNYAQWGGDVITSRNYVVPTGTTTTVFNGAMSQWGAVQVYVACTAGAGTASITLSDGGAFLGSSYSNTFNLVAGGPGLKMILPLMASILGVQVHEGTGTGPATFQVQIVAMNSSVVRPTYLAAQNFVGTTVTVPANSVPLNIFLPWIASGRQTINLDIPGAVGLADVEIRSLTGAGLPGSLLFLKRTVTGNVTYDLALPGTAVVLQLFNAATTALANVNLGWWTDTD